MYFVLIQLIQMPSDSKASCQISNINFMFSFIYKTISSTKSIYQGTSFWIDLVSLSITNERYMDLMIILDANLERKEPHLRCLHQ